jgi:hypothetical protein
MQSLRQVPTNALLIWGRSVAVFVSESDPHAASVIKESARNPSVFVISTEKCASARLSNAFDPLFR